PKVSRVKLLEALNFLGKRSLIETTAASFTQQPVVMEYITDRLVEQVCEEVRTWKCFPSKQSDVGEKHLGDNLSVKPKVYNPNASPSGSLETNPGELQQPEVKGWMNLSLGKRAIATAKVAIV
ncbi:MAG: hypothetical protein F6J92_40715, partial [Symploca sp. SIO1A3]|nr:hypothetical protein [Symploca sp. SIO1A3]